MAKFPFIGPSYVYRSKNFDAQRSINLFPVGSETKTSKEVSALIGTPGKKLFCDLAVNKHRASHESNGRAFFVAGNKVFEVFSDKSFAERGTINTTSGFVSMDDNGQQLCIVDGADGWILKFDDNSFFQIVSDGWMGADTVAFVDGYFVFNKPGTGVYYISALYSGEVIDPLDFASAEGAPDNLVGVLAVHKEVWLFGTNSIEVVFNSGAADFPFTRIQGAFIEYGCISAGSIAKSANTTFWVGNDDQGHGVVWMANGYQPQRISTHAVEYAIQQYLNISDARSYTYQEDGNYFYVLNFSSSNTTWVYDVGMNAWHERAYWNTDLGEYERDLGQTHVHVFGKHLVGDYRSGKLYQQSLNFYDDDGNPIRRLRSAPHLAAGLDYVYYSDFRLDMETGIGLNDGDEADVNPQIMLRWSDDGGHTWSNEHWREAGKIGKFRWRAMWRRLGRSRDRVFQVIFSCKCKVFLISGNVNADKGDN